jgi:signal transduction histidine kinase
MTTSSIEPRAAEPFADAPPRSTVWLIAIGLAAAVGIGLVSVVTSWRLPGFSSASESAVATILTLLAGFSLVGAGLEHVRRGRRRRFGLLLAGAGLAWLLAEWTNPAIESSIGFTVGLLFGWLYPAVVVHAVFVFAGGPNRGPAVMVAAGYAIFGVALGLVPALAFDAAAIHCSFCPDDLVAVAPSSQLAGTSIAIGSAAGAVWSVVVAVVLSVSLVGQSPAARSRRAPLFVPCALFALTLALELGRAAGQSALPTDGLAHLLRLTEAALLSLLAAGALVEWFRARRSRTSVARVVADLGHSPPIGGLRDTLSATLSDPELRIAYPLAGGRAVDAVGRDLDLAPNPAAGRQVTPIVRDGLVVALLEHRAEVLELPETVDEVVRAARLGLEHERLQAETSAQLADLTAARKRIVAAATDERQRLERDLHDGAQQRLIAISIGLRLLAGGGTGMSERSSALVGEATQELALAIDELRDVAHGIYPSVLADEGLSAAIEGLAEGSTVAVAVGPIDVDPLDPSVAEAAYAIVSDVVEAAAGPVRVEAMRVDGSLTLVVDAPSLTADMIVELGDRVGAVDGILTVREAASGRVLLIAEIPCGS